jgi:excisionase family DNA binding protein
MDTTAYAEPVEEDTWLTRREAADLLQVHVRTIDRYREENLLKAYRWGPSRIRFRKEDVEKLIRPERPEGAS